jgi:hypothetical protein
MSFHHDAICRILAIKWNQVREKHVKNEEVRSLLCNILKIDAYITKRTATYLRKVSRSDKASLPKKILAAWIQGAKNTAPPNPQDIGRMVITLLHMHTLQNLRYNN